MRWLVIIHVTAQCQASKKFIPGEEKVDPFKRIRSSMELPLFKVFHDFWRSQRVN
jgi:hypothetical protein